MEETNQTSNNNMMVMGGIVVLILVLIVGFFMMSNKKNTPSTTTMKVTTIPTESQPTSEPTAAITDKNVKTITVEAGSFYYKPNVINVKKGDTVKIVMTAKDMSHNFNIDELAVTMPLTKMGTSSTVEFTANKTGTFEYYCSVGRHRANGQVGKLIVE